jgi:PLP dependent protein
MTDPVVQALTAIKSRIAAAAVLRPVTLVAVSKTFGVDDIMPLLQAGHRVFGENRVQEAEAKWPALKREFPDIELHLIGPLQSNKSAQAVALFDVIQTIDRPKIAAALAEDIRAQRKSPRLLVQVNIGQEAQKAGVSPAGTEALVELCRSDYRLKVSGLMCIPPVDSEPEQYFHSLTKLAKQLGLQDISMGMSSDYEAAIRAGATHVRVGSAIFGARAMAQT